MPRRSKRSLDKAVTDLEGGEGEVVGLKEAYEWFKHLDREGPEDALSPGEYLPPGAEWADAVQETLSEQVDEHPELEPLSPAEIYGLRYMDDATAELVIANLNARSQTEADS